MKTPYILFLLLVLLSFGSCNEPKHNAEVLYRAESLIYTFPDSALQMLEGIPAPEQLTEQAQADYALLLTQARSRCRITATSDSLIRIATDYYQHTDHHARKAKAFLYLGDVYMDMQNNVEAMKALKQAEEAAENADARVQSLIYSNLGYLNKDISNYKTAWIYYKKALNIDKAIGHTEWIVSNLTNILNLPLPEVQDSSTFYVSQMEDALSSVHPDLLAKAYNNIGVYYYKQNQTMQAADYFQKAINTSASPPYRAYLNLARIYENKGNILHADSLYQAALQSPVWATRARIYEALCNRHLHAHRYQDAIKYMKLYQEAADSFYIHRQTKEIQELQAKYDYEVLLREKVQTENLLLRIVVGTGLLLLLSVWGIYYSKKENKRQLQELEDMINQISKLEKEEKEAQNMINELNETLSRHKVLSNEYLRVKGNWTNSEDILALGVYIRLKRDISLYEASSDLPLLGHWLDIVSAQFASRFNEKHQNLTTSELSVCYLHRMGYSLHEIAQAIHVKPDSVKRYIYRACTNMGIPQSREEFTQYVLKF